MSRLYEKENVLSLTTCKRSTKIAADIIILLPPVFFYGSRPGPKPLLTGVRPLGKKVYPQRSYLGKEGTKEGVSDLRGRNEGEKVFDRAILTARYFLMFSMRTM
jgi:hypothetical protein